MQINGTDILVAKHRKMMEIAKMAESKDSENKGFNWKIISLGALAVFTIVGIGASILGGNTNIKLPKAKL